MLPFYNIMITKMYHSKKTIMYYSYLSSTT